MIIPRERKLVRIYVQVSSELAQEYREKNGNPEVIMQTVRDIMKPYRFDASRLEWSTIYVVSKMSPKRRERSLSIDPDDDFRSVTGTAKSCRGMIESSLLAMPSTPTLPRPAKG